MQSQPLAPSSGCQGPDTHFMLCHAGAGPRPASSPAWPVAHVGFISRTKSAHGHQGEHSKADPDARLPEPRSQLHSPHPARTATALPLAATQGNWAVRTALMEEPGLTSH